MRLTPFSTFVQSYHVDLFTYLCVSWYSHTSPIHRSLSKQLAAFPHRLLAHWLKRNEACRIDFSHAPYSWTVRLTYVHQNWYWYISCVKGCLSYRYSFHHLNIIFSEHCHLLIKPRDTKVDKQMYLGQRKCCLRLACSSAHCIFSMHQSNEWYSYENQPICDKCRPKSTFKLVQFRLTLHCSTINHRGFQETSVKTLSIWVGFPEALLEYSRSFKRFFFFSFRRSI